MLLVPPLPMRNPVWGGLARLGLVALWWVSLLAPVVGLVVLWLLPFKPAVTVYVGVATASVVLPEVAR